MLCALAFVLCGCSSGEKGREPEGTVLAEVLGIDRVGTVWVLTAAGRDETGGTVLQTVEDETLDGAFTAMPGSGERWISLTNVAQVLIGDGAELQEVLSFLIEKSGMSWRATVWYAPLAKALMEDTEDGGTARLKVLEQAGEETVTVLDALAELVSEGKTELPVLTVRDGKMEIVGKLGFELAEKV